VPIALLVTSICASVMLISGLSQAAAATPPPPPREAGVNAAGDYIVLGWNDLGMHCYNFHFADLAVLPPYNTLWAQVIRVGNPPQIITTGITVSYSFPNNTFSAGKSDFWAYAKQLFGVDLHRVDRQGAFGRNDRAGRSLCGRRHPVDRVQRQRHHNT
jgi:hypothetical protein